MKNFEADGEPLKAYLLSQNLNEYFRSISNDSATMNKFFTIEFNLIKDLQKEVFREYFDQNPGKEIKASLTLLQKLRNSETHFYISSKEFLSNIEFEQLHNLMVTFYDVLDHYHLLPYIGVARGMYSKFDFDRKEIKSFSYRTRIKNANFVIQLKNNIAGIEFPCGCGEDSYAIAESIIEYCDAYEKSDFDDLWAYIEMLIEYNLLDINEDANEDIVDGERVYEAYCEYRINL